MPTFNLSLTVLGIEKKLDWGGLTVLGVEKRIRREGRLGLTLLGGPRFHEVDVLARVVLTAQGAGRGCPARLRGAPQTRCTALSLTLTLSLPINQLWRPPSESRDGGAPKKPEMATNASGCTRVGDLFSFGSIGVRLRGVIRLVLGAIVVLPTAVTPDRTLHPDPQQDRT